MFWKRKNTLIDNMSPYDFAKKEVKRLCKETKKLWTAEIIIWEDDTFQIIIFHSYGSSNPFESLKGVKRDRYISYNDFNLVYYPSDGRLFF